MVAVTRMIKSGYPARQLQFPLRKRFHGHPERSPIDDEVQWNIAKSRDKPRERRIDLTT